MNASAEQFPVGSRVRFQPRYPENYGFAARQMIGHIGTVEAGHLQPGDSRVPIRYEGGSLYLAEAREVERVDS